MPTFPCICWVCKSGHSLLIKVKSFILEIIKLSEEGMLKAEIGLNLGLLPQMVSQAVNAEKKFFKEI